MGESSSTQDFAEWGDFSLAVATEAKPVMPRLHVAFLAAAHDAARERAQFVGEGGSFSLVDDGPPTEHVHLALPAADVDAVDRFHRELTGAGYRDNGPPGERAVYHRGYDGAFRTGTSSS